MPTASNSLPYLIAGDDMPTEQQIAKYVDLLFRLRYEKDLSSDRFKSLSEEEKVSLTNRAKEENIRPEIDRLLTNIEGKYLSLYLNHTLGPHNKIYRQIFTDITGIILPRGVDATQQEVRKWIGEEKFIERQQAIDKAKADKQAKKEAEHKERMDRLAEKVKANEQIDGESLVELCGYLGLPSIHPRTVGMLRKRVNGINDSTAKVYGGHISSICYSLYRQCQNKLRMPVDIAE